MSERTYCWRCDAHHEPEAHLPRYTVRTRYHVWSVMDRDTDSAVEHFGARGVGDAAAREAARARCRELNADDA